MDLASVEKRKAEVNTNKAVYEKRLNELEGLRLQTEANIQACNGAIQDCDYWIGELTPAPKDKKEGKEEKETASKLVKS